jgi:hypothetical protein
LSFGAVQVNEPVIAHLLIIGSSIRESPRLFRCMAIVGVPSAGRRMKVSLSWPAIATRTCQPGDEKCVVGSVDINISGGRRTGGVGGTSTGSIEIETGGNAPTEAEVIPQDPLDTPEPPKDCAILQNTTAVFASRGEGTISTVRQLKNRFVEAWGEPPTEEFGSSGFKEDYRDKGSSPNQVRHYVGILSTAFKASVTANLALVTPEAAYLAALSAANLRERGGTQGDRADRSLNAVAVGHAVRLAYGLLTIDDLARAIMEDVCDPNIYK